MFHPLIEPLEARIAPATLAILPPANLQEGNSGMQDLVFTVTLTGDIASDVTVQFSTANGSATEADGDYTAASGMLTFHPGDIEQLIRVPVLGDLKRETDETLTVTLDMPMGDDVTIGKGANSATGTIANDDPIPTISIADVTITEGDAGTKNAVFTLSLSNPTSQIVRVVGQTADGTATAGTDYDAKTQSVQFDAGATTAEFLVVLRGELVFEANETFLVNLIAPINGTIGDGQATGTIQNDDPRPTISISPATRFEGDAGTSGLEFTVSLSAPSSEVVSVMVATGDDTALSTSDYTAKTETLTFAPGESSKTFTVMLTGDAVDETDETFFVNLTQPNNAEIGTGQVRGTISNDDLQVTVGNVEMLEGNGETTLTFSVNLSAASAHVVTVGFDTLDGTAKSTGAMPDYDAQSGLLTFDPGQTSQPVTITIHGDLAGEFDETFFLQLTSTNAKLNNAQATATLQNDDPALRINDVRITEGNAGFRQATFTVTLDDGPEVGNVTVDVRTLTEGTAVSGDDYTPLPLTTLTFLPHETTKTISVPVRGDNTDEADETFSVQLSNPTGAAIADDIGIGTIANDDPPLITIGDVALTEGQDGTTLATFTLTLSRPSTSNVTVVATTGDGSAKSGSDYDAKSSTVTFPAGMLTQSFSVVVRGDTVFESDETFFVNLSTPTNGTIGRAQATGTIENDDTRPTISIDDLTLVEGESGTTNAVFNVRLSNASSEVVSVNLATADDSAIAGNDYVTGGTTLTFAPGEILKTFTVPVVGDTVREDTETFFVNLTQPVNGTIGDAQARGTITDTDAPRVRVEDVSIVEGNTGDTTLNFMVKLSTVSATEITVDYATMNGSAVAGADFESRTGTLTFAPGVTALPVAITVHGDQVGEFDENFFLKLTSANGALLTRDTATGTILNDDAILRISDAQVFEGGSGNTTQAVFTVTLEHGPAIGDVVVDYNVIDGMATVANSDYTAPEGATRLTFQPGQTTKTISVAIKGDATPELNEDFQVKLMPVSANATIVDDMGAGNIINDDGAVFTINDVTVTEGDNGTLNALFLVRLLTSFPQEVTVKVQTQNGTATSDGTNPDFDAVTQMLTFPANTTQLQQLVKVPIRGDLIKESTETFRVLLSDPSAGATLARTMGIGTILDNNDPAPTISVSNATFLEGDAGSSRLVFKAMLSQPSDNPVTISFFTRDGSGPNGATASGNDYIPVLNGSVTFEPGETIADIAIPILGDTTDELDETFSISIFNPIGAILSSSSATGTIQNDEVLLSIGDVTLAEGNNGTTIFTFQVALNQAPIGHAVTVNFETANTVPVSAAANADYVSKTGTLTFPAGSNLPQTVSITVNGDTRIEGDEQFFVNLLTPVNAAIGDGQAVGRILNDDGMPKVSIRDALSLTEGDSATSPLTFTVELDKVSDLPVTVTVNTVDGTALAGGAADYTALVDQMITFAPGERMKTVTVQVVGDGGDEPTENFTVQLSDAINATLDDAQAIGTILDNDAPLLNITDMSMTEGDAGTKTITFNVTLSKAALQTVMVDYATADLSALAGQDYVGVNDTLMFAPGETSKPVVITVNGDAIVEGNEAFLLRLSNAHNALFGTKTQAVGTIVDDESTVKLVPLTSTSVDEEVENGVVRFRVERAGDLSQAVSVQYRTVDGTATSTGPRPDFTAKTGTINFAAGSNTDVVISIPITADSHYEFDETFQLELFNPINAAVLDQSGNETVRTAETVTILNNEEAPTLSISNPRIVEGDTGTQDLKFKVTLSAVNERVDEVKVTYDTQDVTANSVAGINILQDYVQQGHAELKIPKGSLEGTITVKVNGDTRDELDEETFHVALSNPVGADLPAGTLGTGTIVDNDAAPTLQFAGSSVTETDTGEKLETLTVQLSAISERPVSVEVTTHDRTAVSTADFTALDHARFFYTPGSQAAQINVTVPILGDTVDEANETFTITLSNPEFAVIQNPTGTVTITDNDNPPAITVNDVSVQEGNEGTTDLVFTVSLSAASEQTVKVDFDTMDGAASSTGPLADYVAKSGTLKFLPGELSKEVRVKVNGDLYKETDETLLLKLNTQTVVNGTILTESGTGTILADGDATVGIAIGDGFVAEGNFGGATLNFTVELSEPLATDTTFRVVTTNGTAASGRDFLGLAGAEFTILKDNKTVIVPVVVLGEGVFEATESFFASLRNVSENLTIADGKGRGTIFNDDGRQVDSQTLQFVDFDGDLVTVHVSEGSLDFANLKFGAPNSIGGRQLQSINLTSANNQFQNTDLSVNAGKQKGFNGDAQGRMGDGHVNVGLILAAIPQGNTFQVVNGVDLGAVQVDGDVGRIFAGDVFSTPAIESLVVRSLGRLGSSTQETGGNTVSLVLGPVNNLIVGGDFAGTFKVIGDIFGSIRNLQIGGALLGGTEDQSGRIEFTGKLRNGSIGSVVGGEGDDSGTIIGQFGSIGALRIGGAVSGGSGVGSASISAQTIQSLTVGGLTGGVGSKSGTVFASNLAKMVVTRNVIGGAGESSGEIFADTSIGSLRIGGELRGGSGDNSGLIGTDLGVGVSSISIFGSIIGGSGKSSGAILTGGFISSMTTGAVIGGAGQGSGAIHASSIRQLNVFGNVEGGSGKDSGGISAAKSLNAVHVHGSILGGDSAVGQSLDNSGYVIAPRIGSLTVNGDLRSGHDNGTGLSDSGTIGASKWIGAVHIRGSVVGNEDLAAIIYGTGTASRPAIRSLQIDGAARFAQILAGYRGDEAVNADARIGTVTIGGDMRNSSIIAGVDAGTDGFFGTNDDTLIGGAGTTDAANSMSKIARIIIGGTVEAGTTSAGIEAQFLKSLRVGASDVALNNGPGNDADRARELAVNSNIHVFELPLPA